MKFKKRSQLVVIQFLLILAPSVVLNSSTKAQTEQLKQPSASWSELRTENSELRTSNDLPSNSSFITHNSSFICTSIVTKCVDYLTERAIASSLLIATLKDKIKNTGEQIKYLEEKVRYYKSRIWTNFITLEPIKLIQNLFGGGDVQKNQLTITDIETKINQLKDNQDRLENQLIVEKDKLKNEIAISLLNIQESRERIKLINQKIAKVKLQSQVFLIKYSNGEGTTNQYLNYQENIDRLDFDLLKANNDYKQNVSKLMLLVE